MFIFTSQKIDSNNKRDQHKKYRKYLCSQGDRHTGVILADILANVSIVNKHIVKLVRASRKKVGGDDNKNHSRHNRQNYSDDTKSKEEKSQEKVKPS